MKENCLLIFLNAPEVEEIPRQLVEAFGIDKIVPTYTDMVRHIFAVAKKLQGIQPTVVYKSSSKYHDLRWLDPEDPGFLSLKGASEAEKVMFAMRWAFDAGAKRVVFSAVNAPGLPSGSIENAFSLLMEKDIVAGPAQDGALYALGMRDPFFQILEGYPWPGKNASEELSERAKRLRLNLSLLPEHSLLRDDKSYQQWALAGRKPAQHTPTAVVASRVEAPKLKTIKS